MRLQIYLCVGHFMMFCNHYELTKALVGVNIQNADIRKHTCIACITRRTDDRLNLFADLICTGTLFTRKHILASEHCFRNRSIDSIQVIIGSINIMYGRLYYPINVITYDEWARQKGKAIQYEENDIAIMKLTEKVMSSVTPARLLYKHDHKLYGKDVVAVGWGIINNCSLPKILQMAALKIITKQECEDRITILNRRNLYLEPRLLCTFTIPSALIQFGDSGGPLFYRGSVVAINKGTAPLPELRVHVEKVNIHFNLKYYEKFISDVKRK